MRKSNSLIRRLKSNMFWRSVAILVSGTAIAQIIGIITTPIVSRLYPPSAFGEYTIIISTSTIILNIVTLGLNSAIMVPSKDEECNEIFMVNFLTMLILTTIIFVGMVLISPVIKFFNSNNDYIISCILVYIFVIINNLRGLLSIYVNRKKLNKVLFFNALIGSLVTLFVTIPMGVIKMENSGLIIAGILGSVACIVQMLYHVNPFGKIPSKITFKKIFNQYKDFILFQYPANFLDNFAIQLPTQMLSINFGNINLGSYSMCEKLLGIPSRFIGSPINTIYFRTVTEYKEQNKDFGDFTFSLVSKVMIISILPIIIIIFWGEPLFEIILGEMWREAGKLASFLIFQYVLMFCQNCTSYCRVAIGKQKVNLIVSILKLFIIAVSINIGVYRFGGILNTVICFTIGSSIYLIIDMAINFYCMGKNCAKYIIFSSIYFVIISCLWIIKWY